MTTLLDSEGGINMGIRSVLHFMWSVYITVVCKRIQLVMICVFPSSKGLSDPYHHIPMCLDCFYNFMECTTPQPHQVTTTLIYNANVTSLLLQNISGAPIYIPFWFFIATGPPVFFTSILQNCIPMYTKLSRGLTLTLRILVINTSDAFFFLHAYLIIYLVTAHCVLHSIRHQWDSGGAGDNCACACVLSLPTLSNFNFYCTLLRCNNFIHSGGQNKSTNDFCNKYFFMHAYPLNDPCSA